MDTDTQDTQVATGATAPVEEQKPKVEAKGADPLEVIGRLQTKIASLEAVQASTALSTREQAELRALIVLTNQKVDLALAHLTDPDAEPSSLATKVQAIKKQGDDARAHSHIQQIRDGYAADIGEGLGERGFKTELEDPRFAEGNRLWIEADKTRDLVGYHKAYMEMQKVFKVMDKERGDKALEAKTKEAEQRFKVENGALAPTSTPGTPGGAESLSSYIQRVKKGEKLPTAEEIDRLTAGYLR